MLQPSSSNLDDQQLPQEIGVCQELSTGSSNEGTIQGASAGRDSHQIHGNDNKIQITQIETQTVYVVPNEGKWQPNIPLLLKNFIAGKASRLLYGHILSWTTLMLVASVSGTVITAPPDRSLLGKEQPHLVSCNNPSLAEKPETLRIAIADFARSDEIQNSNRQMENFLLQQLPNRIPMQLKNQVIVCRLPQAFDNSKEAKDSGKSFDAAVVIWGSIASEGFMGGVEITKSDAVLSYPLPLVTLQEAQNPTFKEQEMLPMVDFLTKLALSQVYYIDNKLSYARWILKEALEKANNTVKTANIHQYLVKSYIGLGAMYENPDPECINQSTCKKAIEAYQKAIKLDSTKSNYFLFIKIGVIYEFLKKPEKAREAYSQLIEPPSSYINDALVNRAILSAKSNREAAEADFEQLISLDPKLGYTSRAEVRLEFWNDVQGAINDLKLLLKEEPNNPNNYHLLGLSQLQAGLMGIAEGKQTYHKLLCYLTDKETRDSIISELNNLARKQPQLKPDITHIIAFIQVYQISSETTCN